MIYLLPFCATKPIRPFLPAASAIDIIEGTSVRPPSDLYTLYSPLYKSILSNVTYTFAVILLLKFEPKMIKLSTKSS